MQQIACIFKANITALCVCVCVSVCVTFCIFINAEVSEKVPEYVFEVEGQKIPSVKKMITENGK